MLDWPNIKYFIAQIIKPGFKELNHLITFITPVSAILKTKIFIDNINIARKTVIYLQGQLSTKLKNKTNILIQIFYVNLPLELWA